ncbi:hypothetical protein ROS1_34780 [Roseibium sp. ROS1]
MKQTEPRRVDKFWLTLIERPAVFLVLVLIGLGMLPVAVWMDLRAISDASLRSQAVDLDQAIGKIRTYYAQNVIARVQQAPGDITRHTNITKRQAAFRSPPRSPSSLGK